MVAKKAGFLHAMLAAACVVVSGSAMALDIDPKELAEMKALYERPASIPYPDDNQFSEAKAALGKTLFFDPRLSRSGVMSCSTCHNPSFSWAEWNATGVGDRHQILGRKDPTILNLAWDEFYFWDGRAESMEEQALGPIEAAGEMNLPLETAIERLKAVEEYAPMFKAAFPGEADPITKENIGKAIATFERGVVSKEAPFDKWLKGDEKAISEPAKRGFVLFNKKANCAACHSSWRFSDGSFHDIGINDEDLGRGALVPVPTMQHAFKTVGLRNIDRRSPYMHNGSAKTLMDVVDHYNDGFVKRESLSGDIKPLNLTQQEKEDLVAFLKTLTSDDGPITVPSMPM